MKPLSPKRFVVLLGEAAPKTVYLGELHRGLRQGVTRPENAIRFTLLGANRVARHYPNATIVEMP